jgi:septal ring factor EnvC (AmiA/AmiB activator)
MMKIIEDREKENQDKKPYTRNPEYTRLKNRISMLREQLANANYKENKTQFKRIRKEMRINTAKRNKQMVDIPNPEYIEVKYVRYADD